ncbi:hypothetical protein E2320_014272, partial [Naja naja]
MGACMGISKWLVDLPDGRGGSSFWRPGLGVGFEGLGGPSGLSSSGGSPDCISGACGIVGVFPPQDHLQSRCPPTPEGESFGDESFGASTTEKAQSGTQYMLLLLLFLLLWTRGSGLMFKAKCLLTLRQSEVDPEHHYKPGDYMISAIVSAMKARFPLLNFDRSPSTKFYNGSFLLGLRIIDAILTCLSQHVVGKVWINIAQWVFNLDFMFNAYSFKHIGAIFSFLIKERKWANHDAFGTFDDFLVDFLEKTFRCSSTKDAFSVKVWRWCRQREELLAVRKEMIDCILSLDSYLIYNTIWA